MRNSIRNFSKKTKSSLFKGTKGWGVKKTFIYLFILVAIMFDNAFAFKSAIGFMRKAPITCPTGYVKVPPDPGYVSFEFCVAKYEMKNVGGIATSQSSLVPWVSIQRGSDESASGSAWKACKDLGPGYDLISNDQWQTIARNIADTASNWSTGTVYDGELNRGHSDQNPNNLLAVTDDSDPCNGTGQSCSLSTWNSQRRVNFLSNGSVIWDFGGNAMEWTRSGNNSIATSWDDWVVQYTGGDAIQRVYGNDQICLSGTASPYCGMGMGYSSYNTDALIRGGGYVDNLGAGIFYSATWAVPTSFLLSLGFRCVFSK